MLTTLLDLYRQARDVRPATVEQYRYALLDLSKFLNRPIEPDDWTDATLNAYLSGLRERVGVYTARQRRANLLVVWRFGYAAGLIPTAPRQVCVIRRPELARSTWTPEQIARLMRHAEGLRGRFRTSSVPKAQFWSAWVRVAYDSALRPADQFSIRLEQIPADGIFEIVQAKTGTRHTIRLRPETLLAVQTFAKFPKRTHLFPRLWDRGGFCRAFRKLAAGAGLAGSPKILRASSATELERLYPGTAWRHLGHAEPSTSVRHYLGIRAWQDRPLPPLPDAV